MQHHGSLEFELDTSSKHWSINIAIEETADMLGASAFLAAFEDGHASLNLISQVKLLPI